MLALIKELQEAAALAIQDHYQVAIAPDILAIQETRKEFEGDFTIVVFPLAKYRLGAPPQVGEQLGQLLQQRLEMVESYNVIKGFLNLSLSESFWFSFLNARQDDASFLRTDLGAGQKVVVEYCSPNTNKPLHLGHLRNIILGDSLTRILEANGYEAKGVCLYNDRGTAICKSMYAWQRAGGQETPQSAGKKGDLLVGDYYVAFSSMLEDDIQQGLAKGLDEETAKKEATSNQAINQMLVKWEEGDEAIRSLWQTMNEWVYAAHQATFERLGVSFDQFYYESDIYQLGKSVVEKGLAEGAFYQKEDGSIWVDLTEEGLDHKLLLRSNGTSVYITQDLAAAQVRYQDHQMDRSVYVVGNEQDYHFKVLFLILQKLGFSYADGLFHLSYGMVDLPSGKMKSREGTRVDADELMDEMLKTARVETQKLGKTEGMSEEELEDLYRKIGLAALKFFLVKVDPKKRMLFDPNESFDIHGHTGPFIQYAYARTAALERRAREEGIPAFSLERLPEGGLNEAERQLLKRLYHYPVALREAAQGYNPSILANYAYELTREFNRFYQGEKILNSELPHTSAYRFALSRFTGKVLREATALLGMEMPERM